MYLEPLKSVLGCSILHYCRKWFIGFFLGENEDMLRLDHLIGSNTDWKRPLHDSIQNEMKPQQVVRFNVKVDWVLKKRHFIFNGENSAEVDEEIFCITLVASN